MKRLNQTTNAPYRCGDVDTDTGRIFRCYDTSYVCKTGFYRESWLLPDTWAAIRDRMKHRARARRKPSTDAASQGAFQNRSL